MKRLSKVNLAWSPALAYAIGLITTDGNLANDNRHINLTSKDEQLILCFKDCLNLKNSIGRKARGGSVEKKYYVLQFGDRNFYEFLLSIGLTPAKSKTLSKIEIPDQYFADFLRGCIDGDGNISIAKHPESQHLQLRIRLCSASLVFLQWVKEQITKNLGIHTGWIEDQSHNGAFLLIYAKADSVKLIDYMYYNGVQYYLKRKFEIAQKFMGEWRNWNTRTA